MKLGGESADNNTFLDRASLSNQFQQSFGYRVILLILIVLTVGMISLGGATRLTGSGLSMVDWNLIMGIFPPFYEEEWEEKFREYQKFPEYQILNFTMKVDEFKRIFYFEYFHRLLGRVIGLITFLLFVLTLIKSSYVKIKLHTFLLFILVSLQGLIGWYMVQSGLVDVPRVSHYRLFVHFFLAMLYLSWLWYLLIDPIPVEVEVPRFFSILINMTIVVFVIQTGFGALLAGLDAGLASHTYPHMFGRLIPENLMVFQGNIINKFFDNPVFINFFHRHWGVLTAFLLGVVGIVGRIFVSTRGIFKSVILYISVSLIVLAMIQPLVGIITLVLRVPVGWGVLHQFLAVLIWSALLLFKLLISKQS